MHTLRCFSQGLFAGLYCRTSIKRFRRAACVGHQDAMRTLYYAIALSACLGVAQAAPGSVQQETLLFDGGDADYRLASASRPADGGLVEIESADDFALEKGANITGMKFQGRLEAVPDIWPWYFHSFFSC